MNNSQPLTTSSRKVWDIPGGIHPAENKSQSLKTPIKRAPLASELIFPLAQHIGAPAEVCVELGERVLKSQMIAMPKGFVSAAIHASTSGEIIAIENRPIAHPSGLESLCIVLKADGLDEPITLEPCADYRSVEKSQLLEMIRNAGIAGMGGAGFPSAVKLATDKKIETLIINATECEPYITADDILMRERAEQIVQGIEILQYIIAPQTETLIGIEDNKPQAIKALQTACANTSIEVVVFPTKYPSGGEKQLISILTGKEVPQGKLPADIGIVCQNVGTCAAIKDAVIDGQPLISRITTVTGETLTPQNYEVALGTPVKDLLAASDFKAENKQRVVMGGPMMGFTLFSDAVPVVKTTNCLLAPSATELPENPIAQACIRCGLCAEACPASLLPQQLYWFARSQNHVQLEKHNLFDCIECGACSFSCPSHIPLVQYYRSAKAEIRAEQADKILAEKAKQRFELRQQRLEQEQAEKEAKRAARKEAALAAQKAASENKAASSDGDQSGDANKQDIIAAAIARTQAKKQALAKENAGQAAEKSADAKIDAETTTTSDEKTLDPAQAAIERAKQKRAAPEPELSEKERLEKDITTLEKRIGNAQMKLESLEDKASDKFEVLKNSLAQQTEKLNAAKEKLAALVQAEADKNSNETPESKSADEPAVTLDPAQAAIERARLARQQQDALSPEQKREQELEKVGARIAAQEKKYATLLEQDPDKAELVKGSLDKLKQKQQDLLQQDL